MSFTDNGVVTIVHEHHPNEPTDQRVDTPAQGSYCIEKNSKCSTHWHGVAIGFSTNETIPITNYVVRYDFTESKFSKKFDKVKGSVNITFYSLLSDALNKSNPLGSGEFGFTAVLIPTH
ncbi:MAG TPA: hypothetical protein VKR58_03130, partial [Aquella sp.]|nr:hypothetical protein [Aquella sp.]